jgi:putative ABC transport system ATP-binding protein
MLVADEPTGNLDLATGGHVADLLFSACRERGMTMLLVTHDPSLAARCDRQIRMRSGQVLDDSIVAPGSEI